MVARLALRTQSTIAFKWSQFTNAEIVERFHRAIGRPQPVELLTSTVSIEILDAVQKSNWSHGVQHSAEL